MVFRFQAHRLRFIARIVTLVGLAVSGAPAVRAQSAESIHVLQPNTDHATIPRPSIQIVTPTALEAGQLRIIFPPHPVPLGVRVSRGNFPASRAGAGTGSLRREIMEFYFAPLSTRLLEPNHSLTRKLAELLDDYRAIRERLVGELRHTIETAQSGPPEMRLAAYTRLATAQDPKLVALEHHAEELRNYFARQVNWSAKRQWVLGRGKLDETHAAHALFEYQVMRAAIFYQDGLLAAQRRLLWEATWRLEEKIFAPQDRSGEFFRYFAPDIMRVRLPDDLPPHISAKFEQHAERKEALRSELRATVYATDDALVHHRRHVFEQLADAQQPRIEALEELAESIRSDLTSWNAAWRRKPPEKLPAALQIKLDAYLAARQQLRDEYDRTWMATFSDASRMLGRHPNAEVLKKRVEEMERRIEEATATLRRKHAATIAKLEQTAAELEARLAPYFSPSDTGATPEARLQSFFERRIDETAFFEYDIAAFEPGLSPRQRALLFAAAVADLALPLPAADRQAGEMPKTIFQ